jgi:signal transduction histidine kinase
MPQPTEGNRTYSLQEPKLMFGAPPTTIGENSAYVVHEVNQPLTAILTNAESALRWLTREPANLDEVRRAIERIIANSRRACDVVRSVRDSARDSLAAAARLDINGVIKAILDLTSLDLRRHAIAIETDLAGNLEPIRGDRVQLERVIANLVANGTEAMSVVQDRQRKLRISTRLDKHGDVLVAVEDSGPGIDPATIQRIFDPLFTTKREGMGLGLSICRSIVEAHGGRLWATPNLSHGSTFRFSIPTPRGKTMH